MSAYAVFLLTFFAYQLFYFDKHILSSPILFFVKIKSRFERACNIGH